jgi:hypothetical protein
LKCGKGVEGDACHSDAEASNAAESWSLIERDRSAPCAAVAARSSAISTRGVAIAAPLLCQTQKLSSFLLFSF